MPESIRIFGVAMAPAAITTSVVARASRVSLPSRQRTPTARPFSIRSERTRAPVFTVIRPVAFIAGRRNASDAEQRRPSRALICQVPTPRWLGPLKSGL